MARIGQIQLVQPVLTLGWSAVLLGERITPPTVLTALLVIGSATVSQRTRMAHDARRSTPSDGAPEASAVARR